VEPGEKSLRNPAELDRLRKDDPETWAKSPTPSPTNLNIMTNIHLDIALEILGLATGFQVNGHITKGRSFDPTQEKFLRATTCEGTYHATKALNPQVEVSDEAMILLVIPYYGDNNIHQKPVEISLTLQTPFLLEPFARGKQTILDQTPKKGPRPMEDLPAYAYFLTWSGLTPEEKTQSYLKNSREILHACLGGIMPLDETILRTAILTDPETAAANHQALGLTEKSRQSLTRAYPAIALIHFPELLGPYEIQKALDACTPPELDKVLTHRRTLLKLKFCGSFVPAHLKKHVDDAVFLGLHTAKQADVSGNLDVDFE
jgi:hypothetical protein